MKFSLAIKASGFVTAVGFNAPATLAALRAGVSGVRESFLWHAPTGSHLPAARVALPQWWDGVGKLADLVAPAIHECLVAAAPVAMEAIPLLLGVAGLDRPFRWPGLEAQLLAEVEHRLGARLHPASRLIARAQVSTAVALGKAAELIRTQRVPCCVVAAVDSLLSQNVVSEYARRRRVLTPDNSNGFIPGEAGGALLVGPPERQSSGELRVLGVGLAREPAPIESEEPTRGEGLTRAVGEALAAAGLTLFDVAWRITDLNGEHYKFKEAAIAAMRFQRKPKEVLFDLWHPAEYLGDVGAALGPCVLGWALHAGQKGYAPGAVALCHFGGDDGERAALVVQYHSGRSSR